MQDFARHNDLLRSSSSVTRDGERAFGLLIHLAAFLAQQPKKTERWNDNWLNEHELDIYDNPAEKTSNVMLVQKGGKPTISPLPSNSNTSPNNAQFWLFCLSTSQHVGNFRLPKVDMYILLMFQYKTNQKYARMFALQLLRVRHLPEPTMQQKTFGN